MGKNDLPKILEQMKSLEQFFGQLPEIVGNAAVNFTDENFDNEGFTDKGLTKWPARKKNPGKKRAILVKTGRLRNSIRYRIEKRKSGTAIILFTDVPYAQIHNEGGAINSTVKVNQFSRKSRKGKKHIVKAHSRKVNTIIPQREFMGSSEKFNADIIQYIEEALTKLK